MILFVTENHMLPNIIRISRFFLSPSRWKCIAVAGNVPAYFTSFVWFHIQIGNRLIMQMEFKWYHRDGWELIVMSSLWFLGSISFILTHSRKTKLISSGEADKIIKASSLPFQATILIKTSNQIHTHIAHTHVTWNLFEWNYEHRSIVLIFAFQKVQSIDVWLLIVIAFSGDNKTQSKSFWF